MLPVSQAVQANKATQVASSSADGGDPTLFAQLLTQGMQAQPSRASEVSTSAPAAAAPSTSGSGDAVRNAAAAVPSSHPYRTPAAETNPAGLPTSAPRAAVALHGKNAATGHGPKAGAGVKPHTASPSKTILGGAGGPAGSADGSTTEGSASADGGADPVATGSTGTHTGRRELAASHLARANAGSGPISADPGGQQGMPVQPGSIPLASAQGPAGSGVDTGTGASAGAPGCAPTGVTAGSEAARTLASARLQTGASAAQRALQAAAVSNGSVSPGAGTAPGGTAAVLQANQQASAAASRASQAMAAIGAIAIGLSGTGANAASDAASAADIGAGAASRAVQTGLMTPAPAGAAAGSNDVVGAAAGSNDVAGAAAGSNDVVGAAAGSNDVVGAAAGSNERHGAAAGSNERLGTAAGSSESLGAAGVTNGEAGATTDTNHRLGAAAGSSHTPGAGDTRDKPGAAAGTSAGLAAAAGNIDRLGTTTGGHDAGSPATGGAPGIAAAAGGTFVAGAAGGGGNAAATVAGGGARASGGTATRSPTGSNAESARQRAVDDAAARSIGKQGTAVGNTPLPGAPGTTARGRAQSWSLATAGSTNPAGAATGAEGQAGEISQNISTVPATPAATAGTAGPDAPADAGAGSRRASTAGSAGQGAVSDSADAGAGADLTTAAMAVSGGAVVGLNSAAGTTSGTRGSLAPRGPLLAAADSSRLYAQMAGVTGSGPATGAAASPAVLAVSPPLGDERWSAALAQQALLMAGRNIGTAELTLNPAQLGPVQVSLALDRDQASAVFSSPHAAVREAIAASLPQLRDMFAAAGMELTGAQVQSGGSQGFGQATQQNTPQAAAASGRPLRASAGSAAPAAAVPATAASTPPGARLLDTFA